MKKTGVLRRIICFILAVHLISLPVYAVSDSEYTLPVTDGCHTIDAQVPMIGASKDISNLFSAFLYDYNSETLVYSVNPDETYDPGSLVKIMTGLIIAEQANLNDQVTVNANLLDLLPGGNYGVDLQDGEIISMQDLLYCIMVESANDAAIIAAHHTCGSLYAFIQEMNRYAEELGCTNTYFTNVHGSYDPLQITTARDIAKILVKAVENDVFMEAFSTVRYSVPATNKYDARNLSSNNFIMNDDMMTIYLDYRVTGGHSTIVDTGERSLAVTAEQNGVELISVVMGSASEIASDGYSVVTFGSFLETSALLNLGFQGHYYSQIFHENQVWTQFEVPNGDSYLSAGVKESVRTLLPHGITYDDLSYQYRDNVTQFQAPIKAGEQITTVQVWYNNVCLAVVDLYAMHDVNIKEFVAENNAADEVTSNAPAALTVMISIIVLLFILLFGRNLIFRLIRKHKIRRSKELRRRNR